MNWWELLLGVVIGAGGSWGLTYLYFHKDKVRAQIANEYNQLKDKANEMIGKVKV